VAADAAMMQTLKAAHPQAAVAAQDRLMMSQMQQRLADQAGRVDAVAGRLVEGIQHAAAADVERGECHLSGCARLYFFVP
jgi:hypothetical protein